MIERLSLSVLAAGLALGPVAASAQEAGSDVQALYEALRLTDIVQVMRDEGIAYGDEIGADLFGGRRPPIGKRPWRASMTLPGWSRR